ncbi:hypothetical protein BJX61DRAFT_507715 [Aspergillus egyptiacus]|nr:hypothetical protein BJX61DRAFT_507715 [Aspergillus egyptiacus]
MREPNLLMYPLWSLCRSTQWDYYYIWSYVQQCSLLGSLGTHEELGPSVGALAH